MAGTSVMKEHTALAEVAYDDEEVALVSAATEPAVDDDDDDDVPSEDGNLVLVSGGPSEAQMNGVMVLSLLDKIIGVVDQIQQTQNGLEARQESMEKSVSTIQGELTKLSKNHVGTANAVNKMLEKVRKVSVNVKTVRSNLEKQAGQIKKLESNENELLKRRNFKVLIYQDQVKAPKATKGKTAETAEANAVEGLEQIPEEGQEGVQANLNSDEEVEIEEIIEESRTKRLQRTTKQQVDNIKKAFSKEKMEKTKLKTKENLEKTRQRTRDNLEKTRQRTRDNLEKTKHSLEKKIGKLGTRMTPNQERRAKMKTSKDKVSKSLTPDHKVYARSKTTVYRVPPFTFHVKKIRDGEEEEEVMHNTEMEEVAESEGHLGEEENGLGVHVEVEEGELVRVDSPEMDTLLEVTEDLVLVETDHLKKAQRE
ncbi:caveolae-associated protein 1 [Hippoglossus hippoglossus]|uniref:caveolae-associated protein 1 n=1 Tax=Hippoglossus hippoglossus TaxID=8267 RepID=UPI00148E36EB|nr:caveolae-associated protein 1 [Hippoglossus hippoglossus]XP_035035683.1 caveolae-associated protein 1 [Hippoglossus stenolepis]